MLGGLADSYFKWCFSYSELDRQQEYNALMDKVWDELRVLVPLETRSVNTVDAWLML